MLVPHQMTDVMINNKNIKHFLDLGYECEVGKIINIHIEHLTKGSQVHIHVKCDYCGNIVKKVFRDYITSKQKGKGLDCCIKCCSIKRNEVIKNKYGVDNVFQLEDVKEKIKITNLEKYGVEYYTQSDDSKIKRINTCLTKYGVENPAQFAKFKEKAKQTNLKRYGFEYTLSSPLIRKKIIKTNIQKYGVDNYTKTQEYKDKVIKTNLSKYGYKYISQVPTIIEKRNSTFAKNGTCRTSSQQIRLHKMIQERFPSAILNYKYSRCIFDVALLLDNNIKIDIEYDGWYWHKNQQKDRRRDEYIKSHGWKILRIKSGRKLPDKVELFNTLNCLINTDYYYKEIILDDWKMETAL